VDTALDRNLEIDTQETSLDKNLKIDSEGEEAQMLRSLSMLNKQIEALERVEKAQKKFMVNDIYLCELIEEAKKNLKKKTEEILARLGTLASSCAKCFEIATSTISDTVKMVPDALSSVAAAGKKQVVAAGGKLVDALNAQKLVDDLDKLATRGKNYYQEKVDKYAPAVAEITKTVRSIPDKVRSIPDKVATTVGGVYSDTKKSIDATVGKVTDAVVAIPTKIADKVESIAESRRKFTEEKLEKLSKYPAAVKKSMTETKDNIKRKLKETKDGIKESVGQIPNKISRGFSALGDQMVMDGSAWTYLGSLWDWATDISWPSWLSLEGVDISLPDP